MGNSAVLICGNHISVLVAGEEANLPIALIQGQTGPLWALTFKTNDNAPVNLTGGTFNSAYLYDQQAPGGANGLLLTGTFAVVSATLGTATFTPSVADVAVPGEYIFVVKFTNSGASVLYFRIPVSVLPRYGV